MVKIAELEKKVNDHEVKLALGEQHFENIENKLDSIDKKLDVYVKVDETHQCVKQLVNQTETKKTGLQKYGETARNVREIVIAVLMMIGILAIFLKVDFSKIL